MLQYVLPISDAAREWGYDILMVTEERRPTALQRITDSNMVDGVVLLNVGHDDPRVAPLRAARAARGARRPSAGHRGSGRVRSRLRRGCAHARRPPPRTRAPRDHPDLAPRSTSFDAWRRLRAGGSATPHSSAARATVCGSTRTTARSQQPAITGALQRDPGRAPDGDRADRPQRRDDRRASAGPATRGESRCRDDLSVVSLFSRRLRTTVLAALHGSRDLARQAGPRCGPGTRATDAATTTAPTRQWCGSSHPN